MDPMDSSAAARVFNVGNIPTRMHCPRWQGEVVGEATSHASEPDDACRSCSGLEQDRQGLLIGDQRAFLQFGQSAASDRVPDQKERVVGASKDPGDIAGCDLERFGAQHHRPLAQLLECQSVVQTAR